MSVEVVDSVSVSEGTAFVRSSVGKTVGVVVVAVVVEKMLLLDVVVPLVLTQQTLNPLVVLHAPASHWGLAASTL